MMKNSVFNPNWKTITLGDLEAQGSVLLGRGNIISKIDIEKKPGDFPVYSSSIHKNGVFGRYGEFMFDEELITWSVDGGGNFFHRPRHKYSVTNVSGYIKVNNQNRVNCQFLYYVLDWQHSFLSFDYTVKAHPSVIRPLYEIPLIDIKEQSKIAEVLSTIDRAIAQTDALIAKHQRIKTGLMQDLLTRGIDEHGQLRDLSTHKFKSTPLGMIPVEWEESNLGKISHRITSGSRWWARYYSDTGAKFIRIGNLTREHVNLRFENLQHVQPPDSSEAKRTVLETGDVLISVTADLGIIGVVPSDLGEAYINQHIALVKLDKEKHNSYFIGNLLSGFQAQKYFSLLNDSGAKAGLNLKTIAAFPVVLPDKEEQDRIAEVILKADKIIQAKKIERKKLLGIKSGLMQDLLSGEVSVTPLMENHEAKYATK